MKFNSPLLPALLAAMLLAGCQCGGPASQAGEQTDPGISGSAAERADAIAAAADAAPDSVALDAAIDAMFAEDDREMAQFTQAEAEAAAEAAAGPADSGE